MFTIRNGLLLEYNAKGHHKKIKIPSGVKEIYRDCFCDDECLQQVIIPEGVTVIGEAAFINCTELHTVILPKTVKRIRFSAFNGCCHLTNINLQNVRTIGSYAFYKCSSLSEIDLTSLETVGENAFEKTQWLLNSKKRGRGIISTPKVLLEVRVRRKSEMVIPQNITYIAPDAFRGASLGSVRFENENTVLGEKAFAHSKIKKIILPKQLETVLEGCFAHSAIESIELPETVTNIERWAFFCCEQLESIVIPANVTCIDEYAFANCHNLKSVVFLPRKKVLYIHDAAFVHCDLKWVCLPTKAQFICPMYSQPFDSHVDLI